MPRWIGAPGGALLGVSGIPDRDTGTGTIDQSQQLIVEPGWSKWRWLDARHLKGGSGLPGTAWAWSHNTQGPQPEPGRRLIAVTGPGWNDVWVDVTDPGGTRRYTSRTFYVTHHYEVGDAAPNQDLVADGGEAYLAWLPNYVQDPDGPTGDGLPMTVEIRPITVPGIAAPPPMVAGPALADAGGNTRSFTVPAGVAGARIYLSFKYTKPSAVPAEGLVWGWEPVLSFPTRPRIPEVRYSTIWHRYVNPVPPAGTTLAVHTPFPVGHIMRPDLTKLPLATNTDFAGAPTQAQASARFVDLLSTKPFWVDCGDSVGVVVYSVPDVAQVPVKDLKWHNGQNVSGGSGVGNGQQIFLGMPVPTGAVASGGTDRNYMVVAPTHLGGTDWSTWTTSQRYGNTEPYGRPRAGGVTPATPQHEWWANTGGMTSGLSTSTSGRLSANHHSSVSGLTMWGMSLMVDEVQQSFAAYHPTNQAAWEGYIDHIIYMLSTRYRHTRLSWPARGNDGTSSDDRDLASGQIVSIHPDLDLTTLNWAGKKLGHILARAIQRRGLIQADTCGGGGTNIGCQSGLTYRFATGVSPWTALREGNSNGSHLTPIPTTFVHPVTSVVTQTWRVHRVIASEADWNALNA